MAGRCPTGAAPAFPQIRRNDVTRSFAIAAACLLAGSAAAQQRPAGTARTDLQRHDLSIGGWETLQALVTFEPGSTFPRHKHPGEEIIYVTEGSVDYEVAGKWQTVKAGGVLFIPNGTVHAARNTGTVRAAELATYVVEKGKPLSVFAE
jgi:quercetin dioxygenase-like cupin family protein